MGGCGTGRVPVVTYASDGSGHAGQPLQVRSRSLRAHARAQQLGVALHWVDWIYFAEPIVPNTF